MRDDYDLLQVCGVLFIACCAAAYLVCAAGGSPHGLMQLLIDM